MDVPDPRAGDSGRVDRRETHINGETRCHWIDIRRMIVQLIGVEPKISAKFIKHHLIELALKTISIIKQVKVVGDDLVASESNVAAARAAGRIDHGNRIA